MPQTQALNPPLLKTRLETHTKSFQQLFLCRSYGGNLVVSLKQLSYGGKVKDWIDGMLLGGGRRAGFFEKRGEKGQGLWL